MRSLQLFCISTTVVLLALGASAAFAADEAQGWTDTAEFSFVGMYGNSESMSLGLKNTLARQWDKSGVTFRFGAIRVETTGADFAEDDVVMEAASDVTAENYFANGRYDRKITDRFFWFAGAGWERNELSGIKNRWIGEAGVGNIWIDKEDVKFKTNYGLTYTDQEDVVPNPALEDSFLGLRLSWDYGNQLTKTTRYTNVLVVDENLDETEDWRANMDNGLAVSLSEKMALKVGLQFLYDNLPSLETIPNADILPPVNPTTLDVALDELDTIMTISLVVDFM